MELNWIEAIGYGGTLATVVTYSMKSIIPLRIAGIASSTFFITYASIMGVWPILLMECVLLPINSFRLYEAIKQGTAAAPVEASVPVETAAPWAAASTLIRAARPCAQCRRSQKRRSTSRTARGQLHALPRSH